MKVEMLLFATLREAAGVDRETIEVADGTQVARIARDFLRARGLALAGLPPLRFAVNDQFVSDGHVPRDGDRIAVLSPFAGG